MPQVDISTQRPLDLAERVVRSVRPVDVMRDTATGEVVLIPTALRFNDDLSIAREKVILEKGSTIKDEFTIPPNGAIVIPAAKLAKMGARLTETPRGDGTILGDAHASVWGIKNSRPSPTEKSNLRDAIIEDIEWLYKPEPIESELSG